MVKIASSARGGFGVMSIHVNYINIKTSAWACVSISSTHGWPICLVDCYPGYKPSLDL